MTPLDLLPKTAPTEPMTVALTTTARPLQIQYILRELKNLFPNASYHLITQEGRGESVRNEFPTAQVHEALPPGKFVLFNAFGARRQAIRMVNPELTIVVYNNPAGAGYLLLGIYFCMVGAGNVVGVYHPVEAVETANAGVRSVFRRLSVGGVIGWYLGRALLPIFEFIIFILVLVIYMFYSLFAYVTKGFRTAPKQG